jgi:hypothetical protein
MVIGQKYLLKEYPHTVTVHPCNKWKPIESLVPSLREEPAEKKWEEMLLGRQVEMMVLRENCLFLNSMDHV